MSILNTDVDRETLAAIFKSRVDLAKKNAEEAAADAVEEHRRTQKWFASNAKGKGSFLWMCDLFDLESDAVRREIKSK